MDGKRELMKKKRRKFGSQQVTASAYGGGMVKAEGGRPILLAEFGKYRGPRASLGGGGGCGLLIISSTTT